MISTASFTLSCGVTNPGEVNLSPRRSSRPRPPRRCSGRRKSHHGPLHAASQLVDRLLRPGLDRIPDEDEAQVLGRPPPHGDRRPARSVSPVRGLLLSVFRKSRRSTISFSLPTRIQVPSGPRRDASLAGCSVRTGDQIGIDPVPGRILGQLFADRDRDRMRGEAFGRRGRPQQFLFTCAFRTLERADAEIAFRERAGLIGHHTA